MNKWYTKRSGVRIIIKETGEEFNSITACARRLGVDASWLSKVASGNKNLFTCHGYHIIRVDGDYIEPVERRGRPGKRIRIVETGEEYDSITDCARSINGSVGTISDILRNKRNRASHKGMHFELIDEY